MSLATGIAIGSSIRATRGSSISLFGTSLIIKILAYTLIGLFSLGFICGAIWFFKDTYELLKSKEKDVVMIGVGLFISLFLLIVGLILFFLMINI